MNTICDCGCQTIAAMTRKINSNVHLLSHIKEKIVHIDTQDQEESKILADIDDSIAKVSSVCQLPASIRSSHGRRRVKQVRWTMAEVQWSRSPERARCRERFPPTRFGSRRGTVAEDAP